MARARERIVSLSYDKAVEAIEDTSTVLFRRGVWNPWNEIDTKDAIKRIKNSGYGADIFKQNGILCVSCPVDSDMW